MFRGSYLLALGRMALVSMLAGLALLGVSAPCLASVAPSAQAMQVRSSSGLDPHCPPADPGRRQRNGVTAACTTACIFPAPEQSDLTAATFEPTPPAAPAAESTRAGLPPDVDYPPPR